MMASSDEQTDCICVPGYFGPDGGPCTLCPVDFWCPGGNFRYRCTNFSSSVAGSSEMSDCICDAQYAGPRDGRRCDLCDPNFYCPGGNLSYACPGTSISPAGSDVLTDCTCAPELALLFNYDCQLLDTPLIQETGTMLPTGEYVGMARITLSPPAFANVTYAFNNQLSCAASTSQTSVVIVDNVTVTAASCALDGEESDRVIRTYRIAEGAKVIIGFGISGNPTVGNGLRLGLRRRFGTLFNMAADQIAVDITETRRRHLLATSVQANLVADSQSQFNAVEGQSQSITANDMTSILRVATGDNSLSAENVQ
eukprot:2558451-Rhodomonas_salina.1